MRESYSFAFKEWHYYSLVIDRNKNFGRYRNMLLTDTETDSEIGIETGTKTGTETDFKIDTDTKR